MNDLEKICKLLRYYILTSTTKATSGHATSSLSSVDFMAILFYKYFRFDLENPGYINNDRLIFSKGHASPLFYSLYKVAGKLSEKEILSLRKFDSVLEGHPTKRFEFTEVPTGSLGQGLSAGLGMAITAKMEKLNFLTYVLLGDGEMAEGQVWEALEIASYYKLNNLIGMIDVNRLGQTGQTLLGYDISALENRIKSFGARTYIVNDGHNLSEIDKAYQFVLSELPKSDSPFFLLFKTVKGKGVSFLEDRDGWHGRALSKKELDKALKELGTVDKKIKGIVNRPAKVEGLKPENNNRMQGEKPANPDFIKGDFVSTREAYGMALTSLGRRYKNIVVLDGDVSNSTFSRLFKEKFPDRYFEMFIAEQNMVSAALGISERGKVPFVSTFSAFLERAHDQIRMAYLSGNSIVFCGSHSGVSIGEDGPSQMGLEDMSFFRSLPDASVIYPSDGVSCYKLTVKSYSNRGITYIRTMRPKTPVIYDNNCEFESGGSITLKESDKDRVTIISAGICVHEALKAYKNLKERGIDARVIDCYFVKPIDNKTILKAAKETDAIVTVEDHYVTGGLGDAVLEALSEKGHIPVYKLGINKLPRSGKTDELLEYEGISEAFIVKKIKEIIG